MAIKSPRLAAVTELGPAWAGNSVNCVPYRHTAFLRRGGRDIISFFDPTGAVVVAEVQNNTLKAHYVLKNVVAPNDAHQAISAGLDSFGHLHLAWGAHNSVLQIAVSHEVDLSAGFATASLRESDGITYPMFIRTPEELLLMYRRGPHFRGELVVSRLGTDPLSWVCDPTAVLSGLTDRWPCGPYINTPVFAGDGRIVLFIVWRLPSTVSSAGAVVNIGIDCMASANGFRSLETFSGVAVKGTVGPVYSERVIPTPFGSSLINQASAAVMPDGRPAFLTYWDPGDGLPQYKMGWPETDGSKVTNWRLATLSRFTTRFSLNGGGTLPLPHSRPELLFDTDGTALVLFRSSEYGNRLMLSRHAPPDYDSVGEPLVLVDEDLEFYEPIVSRVAWEASGALTIYVQRCAQGVNRDGQPDRDEAPARLMRWDMTHDLAPKAVPKQLPLTISRLWSHFTKRLNLTQSSIQKR